MASLPSKVDKMYCRRVRSKRVFLLRFYFAAGGGRVRGAGSLSSPAGWWQQAPGGGQHRPTGIVHQGRELDRRAEKEL